MEKYKEVIIEEVSKCLVTEDEWQQMLRSKLSLELEDDPFKDTVPLEDREEAN